MAACNRALLATLICLAATSQAQDPASLREATRKALHDSLLPPPVAQAHSVFAQCVTLGDRSLLTAPFASTAEVDAFVDAIDWQAVSERYQANDRWFTTATTPTVIPRQPVTITWSLVPDGTFIPGYPDIGQPDGGSVLFSTMNAAFAGVGGEAAWRAKFTQIFNWIGERTGITYVEVTDDGAPFPFTPGSNTTGQVRGDVRISMRPFAGPSGVLAYNYYPDTGDMVIDAQDISLWRDALNDYRTLRNMLSHEHGHGLGYGHVLPAPPSAGGGTKLMEPFLATRFDGPQQDDLRGFQYQYGDGYEPDNTPAQATLLGELTGTTPLRTANAALESGTETDLFAFTLTQPGLRGIFRITPIGTTYLQGPQSGTPPPAPVNAQSILDLTLDFLDADGSTVLATAASAPIGQAEVLPDVDLETIPPGTYYVRVRSSTPTDDIQRYNLELRAFLSTGDCNQNGLEDRYDLASVADAPAADQCGDAFPISPYETYAGSTAGATNDGTASCGSSNGSPDRWYLYIPTRDGTLDVDLCGSGFDTVLSILEGCGGPEIAGSACSDDSDACGPGSTTSRLEGIPVRGGVRYLIRVSGKNGAAGPFTLYSEGPDALPGRETDHDGNLGVDACDPPQPVATITNFNLLFNYGETHPDFTTIPPVLGTPQVPGFSGSAPAGSTEIGMASTPALANQFATWRRNLGVQLKRDLIYRVRTNLRTDATPGASNWVRFRFGGDFAEANGQSELGFASNAASLPTGSPRTIEMYHWSKCDSGGTSAPNQPDQPGYSFDLIDESPTIGGHFAAISNIEVDSIARGALGRPTTLRNKGIANLTWEDGFSPPPDDLTPFTIEDGYTVGILNDPGSQVSLVSDVGTPVLGAMNLMFSSPPTGDHTGFASLYVNRTDNPQDLIVAPQPDKIYSMDVWITPATPPNTTSQRPPLLRMRFIADQVSFNHGQISTTIYNMNPDPNFDGAYDNPAGLHFTGRATHYASFWRPNLDTDAQPNTDSIFFVDLLFNRRGTSAVRPTGTYTIERFAILEYDAPTF